MSPNEKVCLIDRDHGGLSLSRQANLLGVSRSVCYYQPRVDPEDGRFMRLMGLEVIYPKPNLSRPHPDHEIFPYHLKNLDINRGNLVWGSVKSGVNMLVSLNT